MSIGQLFFYYNIAIVDGLMNLFGIETDDFKEEETPLDEKKQIEKLLQLKKQEQKIANTLRRNEEIDFSPNFMDPNTHPKGFGELVLVRIQSKRQFVLAQPTKLCCYGTWDAKKYNENITTTITTATQLPGCLYYSSLVKRSACMGDIYISPVGNMFGKYFLELH